MRCPHCEALIPPRLQGRPKYTARAFLIVAALPCVAVAGEAARDFLTTTSLLDVETVTLAGGQRSQGPAVDALATELGLEYEESVGNANALAMASSSSGSMRSG